MAGEGDSSTLGASGSTQYSGKTSTPAAHSTLSRGNILPHLSPSASRVLSLYCEHVATGGWARVSIQSSRGVERIQFSCGAASSTAATVTEKSHPKQGNQPSEKRRAREKFRREAWVKRRKERSTPTLATASPADLPTARASGAATVATAAVRAALITAAVDVQSLVPASKRPKTIQELTRASERTAVKAKRKQVTIPQHDGLHSSFDSSSLLEEMDELPTTSTPHQDLLSPSYADVVAAVGAVVEQPPLNPPASSTPTTPIALTSAPTTAAPATADPVPAAPATAVPTTAPPTSAAPSTAPPTTSAPATASPTTAAPATSTLQSAAVPRRTAPPGYIICHHCKKYYHDPAFYWCLTCNNRIKHIHPEYDMYV
jgi:hypothetical protein